MVTTRPPLGDEALAGSFGVPSRALFWLLLAAAVAVFVWLLRDVLLPFVAGLIVAYLLNPLVNQLERIRLSRTLAVLMILIVFLIVAIAALVLVLPLLGNQLVAFLRALPGYVTRLHAFAIAALQDLGDNPIARYMIERLGGANSQEQNVSALIADMSGWVGSLVTSVWSGGRALVQILGLMVLTPIIAFYLLIDWPRMLATVDGWLPLHQAGTVRQLAHDIDAVVAAFVRGQASVCLAVAIFYAITLTATGLNFGLLIGVFAGLASFIPYVGHAVGFLLAIGVGFVQFWPDWTQLAVLAGIFIAGQILDGYVLQPNMIGNSVGLHPVWLMFALVAFGSLLGFVGLLLAVPLAASIGVLARFAIRRYQASTIYTGEPPVASDPG
jgi:predicted PurR-regulated permease PerM